MMTAVMPLHRAAAQPVELPIVERKGEHEAVQYDYHPWYIPNVPAFDSFNRPYMRSRAEDPHTTGYIQTLRDGRWVRLDFTQAIREAYPTFATYRHAGGTLGACITFDADDAMYTIVRIRLADGTERDLLLFSSDLGESFQVLELPTDQDPKARPTGSANIEQRTGYNTLTRPPLITVLQKRADHPTGKWTAHYNMQLIQPRKEGGKLVLSEPTLLTDHGLYMSRHAGNPSFAASGPDKTFVTWAETTEHDFHPGCPTFVATFDPQTLQVSDRQFCGYAYPVNNGHNSPGIVLDDEGYLHVLTGSHGEEFMYTRSNEPFSTAAGMTKPEPSLETGWSEFGAERGRQCYLSFVTGKDGVPLAAFRQWFRQTQPYHLDNYFGGLSFMAHSKTEGWPDRTTLVIAPPFDDYSIYYQNLAVDRDQRVYLSYGYRTPVESYGTGEAQNHYLALLMSEDNGETWRLMGTSDFASQIHEEMAADGALRPATLRVIVVSPDGTPVVGAHVAVGLSHAAVTGEDGYATFPGVLTNLVDVEVSADDYSVAAQSILIEGDTAECEIVMSTQSE